MTKNAINLKNLDKKDDTLKSNVFFENIPQQRGVGLTENNYFFN